MAIIQGNAKQGSTRGFYPKVINGSLRFNDDDSAYLSWTPASAGNRKTWTWSGWIKRNTISTAEKTFFGSGNDFNNFTALAWINDKIFLQSYTGGSQVTASTTAVYRDPSAWYHVVLAVDTTQGTAADRLKLYVNGVQESGFTGSSISLNQELWINSSYHHSLGARAATSFDSFADLYFANVHFIDGQALTASDFGSLKNGVWVAEDYAGTFGTNGFYLTFEDDTEVEAFNTVLYTGNGSTAGQSVTGVGFAPDLIWLKARSAAGSHMLNDTVRGAGNMLLTNATNAEETGRTDKIESLDSDGFTIGSENNDVNQSGKTFVAWCWKAGDSNVSNTDGTITSTVRANDTYGFSIVSYTGNNTAGATVGHGLSTAPSLIIQRNRTSPFNWLVVQGNATYTLHLNETSASPTSTGRLYGIGNSVFTLGSHEQVNRSSDNYIAYCWADTSGNPEGQRYSKFGSYTGTGSNQTINFGFRPAFLLLKVTDAGDPWIILDGTRETVNDRNFVLQPNSSAVEDTDNDDVVEFTDTGVIIKSTSGWSNRNGFNYIYAAFADTREAAFWLDQSGNDNDWQPVNLDHNDTLLDSPTNNFATWNPLASTGSGVTGYGWSMSDGNLVFTPTNASGYNNVSTSTMAMTSGKYYFEFRPTGSPASGWPAVGLCYTDSISTLTSTSNFQSSNDVSILIFTSGNLQPFGSTTASAYGNAISSGDVLMLAVDCDNGKVWWGENGTWFNSGNPTTGTNAGDTFTAGTALNIFMTGYNGAGGVEMNCGQQPFKYDPPA